MYTAAEALRRSDCQLVTTENEALTFRFNEEFKIWECKRSDGFTPSRSSSQDFMEEKFYPVMKEKTELEKAGEKYFGKWVRVPEAENLAFKVLGLYEVYDHINVIRSEHQSYHIDQIELLEIEK